MTKKKTWRSFEKARKFVQLLNLKNSTEWKEYKKSGKKPTYSKERVWKKMKMTFKA